MPRFSHPLPPRGEARRGEGGLGFQESSPHPSRRRGHSDLDLAPHSHPIIRQPQRELLKLRKQVTISSWSASAPGVHSVLSKPTWWLVTIQIWVGKKNTWSSAEASRQLLFPEFALPFRSVKWSCGFSSANGPGLLVSLSHCPSLLRSPT